MFSLMFNDFYQLTMVYSYWKNNRHNHKSVFALYFRKNPFNREFTVFAGLNRFLEYLDVFTVNDSDVENCKKLLGEGIEDEFFIYLKNLNLDDVEIQAFDEGSLVFPSEPLVQLRGPIAVLQLLETILLNLTNFASLVATNAAHFRIAAGNNVSLLEFGCRRAQGPDGALSSSLYSYIGGFDGTSNVEAATSFDIPAVGTVAHSFISSFSFLDNEFESKNENMRRVLLKASEEKLKKLAELKIFDTKQSCHSELIAFVSFAISFPSKFLVLIDTYSVLMSGLPNFCAVALSLNELNYKATGVRLDSGDLAYFSIKCREAFIKISQSFSLPWFSDLKIVASNEINIDAIYSMNMQKHQINAFGIGNNLVTCSSQPSLGMVYKLVEFNDQPTIKLTEELEKVSIPFMKNCYRLYNSEGLAILDLLTLVDEPPPKPNTQVFCFHPFDFGKKGYVTPYRVVALNKTVFKKSLINKLPNLLEIKNVLKQELTSFRSDYLRYVNPAPYKISLSEQLYHKFHSYKDTFPINEIQ